jgi:ABC-type branched-subunit amino acid transport system substrate-binding protein
VRNSALSVVTAVAIACGVAAARAETPGVTTSEIKIGNTVPYSGPVSSKGVTGRIIEEYFAMVNEKGGVNGRRLKLYSLDDAFSPPKTVEAVRRLVAPSLRGGRHRRRLRSQEESRGALCDALPER